MAGLGDIFGEITRDAKQTGLVIAFIIVIVIVLLLFTWIGSIFS